NDHGRRTQYSQADPIPLSPATTGERVRVRGCRSAADVNRYASSPISVFESVQADRPPHPASPPLSRGRGEDNRDDFFTGSLARLYDSRAGRARSARQIIRT